MEAHEIEIYVKLLWKTDLIVKLSDYKQLSLSSFEHKCLDPKSLISPLLSGKASS